MLLCVFTFMFAGFFFAKCVLETHQHYWILCFHSPWSSRFSRFLVPSRQRNQSKSFFLSRKTFCGRKLLRTRLHFDGNKTINTARAVSLNLTRSGSLIQRGIWFILPAHGAGHTEKILIKTVSSKSEKMLAIYILNDLKQFFHVTTNANLYFGVTPSLQSPRAPSLGKLLIWRRTAMKCTKVRATHAQYDQFS